VLISCIIHGYEATSKGFHQSIDDLKPDAAYVITPGGERYDRSDGLRVCPLEVFLEREMGLG
jgi:hypothetical protein